MLGQYVIVNLAASKTLILSSDLSWITPMMNLRKMRSSGLAPITAL
jgi:hypothetical protein